MGGPVYTTVVCAISSSHGPAYKTVIPCHDHKYYPAHDATLVGGTLSAVTPGELLFLCCDCIGAYLCAVPVSVL